MVVNKRFSRKLLKLLFNLKSDIRRKICPHIIRTVFLGASKFSVDSAMSIREQFVCLFLEQTRDP